MMMLVKQLSLRKFHPLLIPIMTLFISSAARRLSRSMSVKTLSCCTFSNALFVFLYAIASETLPSLIPLSLTLRA